MLFSSYHYINKFEATWEISGMVILTLCTSGKQRKRKQSEGIQQEKMDASQMWMNKGKHSRIFHLRHKKFPSCAKMICTWEFLFQTHFTKTKKSWNTRFDSGTPPLFLMYVLRFSFHLSFLLSLTLANQLTLQANILKSSVSHFHLDLFPDCIIWFQRLHHLLLLFVICRYCDSNSIPSIITEPLNIIHLFSLLIFPSLPRISSSLSVFNRMDKFSNQCLNSMGLYNKHKHTVSSRQHYHKLTGLLHSCTFSVTQTNLRPLKQKSPSHTPLMPTQTSEITLPVQTSSPRNLVAPGIDQPLLTKFEWCIYKKFTTKYTSDIIFLIKWNSTRVTHNLTACHLTCFDIIHDYQINREKKVKNRGKK
ncbi:hypothetical protein VP01_219g1 [Puccinia sorghi]|uniref:Uncharacterized protein n=1 Tax=Puccinia sorghi TaxID=27349 RepID=A0A0L6VAT9_9BASI|nr:hypothetical protein VP01_219g1 [Puccinia sorghi]